MKRLIKHYKIRKSRIKSILSKIEGDLLSTIDFNSYFILLKIMHAYKDCLQQLKKYFLVFDKEADGFVQIA